MLKIMNLDEALSSSSVGSCFVLLSARQLPLRLLSCICTASILFPGVILLTFFLFFLISQGSKGWGFGVGVLY